MELGPEVVQCPNTFRLFLFARDASSISNLPQGIRGLVTPVNFVLTQRALEQQLLGRSKSEARGQSMSCLGITPTSRITIRTE